MLEANSHYFDDNGDAHIALDAFIAAMNGDRPSFQVDLERVDVTADRCQRDFFSLPFRYDIPDVEKGYSALTELYQLGSTTGDVRYFELAVKFGEAALARCRKILTNERGPYSSTHMFAMACNNTGSAYKQIADAHDSELSVDESVRVGNIHLEGFRACPLTTFSGWRSTVATARRHRTGAGGA